MKGIEARQTAVEDAIKLARESVQNRSFSGGPEICAWVFAEALIVLGDSCVIGLPCERHGCAVHGREAEELRAGVERILEQDKNENLRRDLQRLLDEVNARDSLAFRELTDDLGDDP